MLDDKEIDKLCHGRLVYADVYDSAGRGPAGVHWLVLIDSDQQIRNSDTYRVVGISHNKDIDPDFCIPVPRRIGLDGFIVCSWQPAVDLPGIKKIGQRLFTPEMNAILELVQKATAERKRQQKASGKKK